ncbi:Protein CBG27528 [Caenorhabditis briggsae]|nr:Protein CBG27528 [Caenorhabditis briggsae]CAS00419.1 Protein CBG27528 [Caenorhabditis briggsae]
MPRMRPQTPQRPLRKN